LGYLPWRTETLDRDSSWGTADRRAVRRKQKENGKVSRNDPATASAVKLQMTIAAAAAAVVAETAAAAEMTAVLKVAAAAAAVAETADLVVNNG
jgi:hypothetical protein